MNARVVVLAVAASIAVSTATASADWFADVYGGRSFTDSHDVSVKGRQSGVPVDGHLLDVRFDDSWMFGARLGRWFDGVRFMGLALDVARFYPDIATKTVSASGTLDGPLLGIPPGTSFAEPVRGRHTEVEVTAVSFDLMLRVPLVTSR